MKKISFKFILFILLTAISWAITCGMVYLISLCFGFAYNLSVATGIWLVLIIIKSIIPDRKR